MIHQNNEREKSSLNGDVYLSPPELVDDLTTILKRVINTSRAPDMLWDPAAADGRLLKHFENSGYEVKQTDLVPMRDTVQRLDFLQQPKRPVGNDKNLMMVFNPPFALTKQRNGIRMFLNQSARMLAPNEYVVCIAPITFSNYNVLGSVDKHLHLVEENFIRRNITFLKPDTNKKKQVHLVIQVWQKQEGPSPTHGLHEKLTLTKQQTLPFKLKAYHNVSDGTPSFYILRKGTGKDVGMTLTSNEIVGKVLRKGRRTIGDRSVFEQKHVTFCSKKHASIVAIHVNEAEKTKEMLRTFHRLYTVGIYTRYLGYGMYQGVQTINTSALKFMALYPDKVPTRESLHIKINFIGDKQKIEVDQKNRSKRKRFVKFYQSEKKSKSL